MRIAEQSQANAFREVFSIWPEYQEAKHLREGRERQKEKKRLRKQKFNELKVFHVPLIVNQKDTDV